MRKHIILLPIIFILCGCQKTSPVITVDGTDPKFGDQVNAVERNLALSSFEDSLKATENITIKYNYSFDNSMLYKNISSSLLEKKTVSSSTLLTTDDLKDESLLAVSQKTSDTEYQGMKTSETESKQVLSKAFRIYDEASSTKKYAVANKTLSKNANYSYYGASYSIQSYSSVDSYQWKETLQSLVSDYLPYTDFDKAPIYKAANVSSDATSYNIFALVYNKSEVSEKNYLYPNDDTKNIGISNEESALLSFSVSKDDSGVTTYTPTSLTYHLVKTPVTDYEFTKNNAIMEEETWKVTFDNSDASLIKNSDIENNFTWDSVTKELTSVPALYVYNSSTLASNYDDVKTQKSALKSDKNVTFTDYSSSYQQIKGGNYHYYSMTVTKKSSELSSQTFAIRRYLHSNQSTTEGYVLYGLSEKQALVVNGNCTIEYFSTSHNFFTITPTGTDSTATYDITLTIDYPQGLDETPTLTLTFKANR